MASQSKTDVSDMMKRTQQMLGTLPAMTPQMEQFWKTQEGILDDVEDFSRAWFARRHEATRSALETVRQANGDGADPTAAVGALADWQRHAMERMTEDMREWMELCTRCASRMAPLGQSGSGTADKKAATSGPKSARGAQPARQE